MKVSFWPIEQTKVELHLLTKLHTQGAELQTLRGVPLDGIDSHSENMRRCGIGFKSWCRARAVDPPPVYWDMNLIGRDNKKTFPVLHSNVKASQVKTLMFFVADLATEINQYCDCPFAELLHPHT